MSPFGVPTSFDLKTQTSHDVEGGIRASAGPVTWQTSVYYMELENELHFSPATFTNTNLDPTQRYGVENILTWRVADYLRLKAGLAYTRSKFREGPFAGNDVPLVSPWTGSVAVSWDIYQKYLVLDAVARFFSNRRMDNDQRQRPAVDPGADCGRRAHRRRDRQVLLVGLGAERVQHALFRLRDRERVHVRESTALIRCRAAPSWCGRGCSSEAYANKRRAAGPPGC